MSSTASNSSRLLRFVDEAQEEISADGVQLRAVLTKAARVARLRGDLENLYWLEMEMYPIKDRSSRTQIEAVLVHKYGQDWSVFQETAADLYFKRREVEPKDGESEGRICALSVGEIEAQIDWLKEVVADLDVEQDRAQGSALIEMRRIAEERAAAHLTARDLTFVREKIRAHVATFLSVTETQLLVGEVASDIFEENRRYVDRELKEISDRALMQLSAAYRRRAENDDESGSQALVSCRRVLKSLADALYPPTNAIVKGVDGRERKMSDDKFLARLLQFVADRAPSAGTEALMQARLQELAARIDAINILSSKGVHAEVSDFEVNQCVIQTYLLVGDLLQIREPGKN